MSEPLTVPMRDYVRDSFHDHGPTLSSGLAHTLLSRSPLHAWAKHPRLNPDWQEGTSEAFDIGVAAHDLIVEGSDARFCVIEADDWRTKSAREARDGAREDGLIPLLQRQWEDVEAMAEPVRRLMATSDDLAGLGMLVPEQTFLWQYQDVGHREPPWLRCRPDWVTEDHEIVLSFKTAASAKPEAFTRSMLNFGYTMQAAFELHAIGRPQAPYIWIVAETTPPYGCSLVGLSPSMRDYAFAQFDAAVMIWLTCLEKREWPGYPTRVLYPEVPAWALAQQMEQEIGSLE